MKKTSLVSLVLFSCLSLLSLQGIAQPGGKGPGGKHPMPGAPQAPPYIPCSGPEITLKDGFKQLCSGLEYKIYKHGKGTKKAVIGDHIDMNILVHVPDKKMDSVIFDSRKMNNNKPVPFDIKAPAFKGDPIEAFMLLVAGDSAVIRISIDSLKKAGNQLLPWMKEGHKIVYNLSVVDVLSPQEKKIQDSINASKQYVIDDKILQDYFKEHHINPKKTASGLYYTITKEGTGKNAEDGWNASIMYTGSFINGKKFDSNVDTTFHHSDPFNLEVGKGKVIKGWDEGLKLLKKGSVATFYIPSPLAYGTTERQNIPANSIMIFDMEVKDMYTQNDRDDELIQEYISKNNLKTEKTESGIYYVIKSQGTGDFPANGKNMSMNYTGRLIDGKTFDSNVDTNFHHTDAFVFPLGKGKVIKGWDEGLKLFKKGGKGTLIIPSRLAYGAQDRKPSIPANSCLVFDVEVLDIFDQDQIDEKQITKYLKDNNINAQKTTSGLYYKITKEGTGDMPKSGQKVVVNYTGMTVNGKKFDSNMDSTFHHVQPFSFPLGQGQVIKGWDEGIALLKKGSKATLFIPSAIAYGEHSPTPAIPPNAVLIFDVELVDIQQ